MLGAVIHNKMKVIIIAVVSTFLLSGCMISEHQLSSRLDIENFSKDRPYNQKNWFYCGTDAKNHHFITRMGGNSTTFIIPKEQIKLTKTILLPPSGVITIHQIYPDENFRYGNKKFQWHYVH